MNNGLTIKICLAALLWSSQFLSAQFPAPILQKISPAGGQLGTDFQVVLSGVDLDKPELKFSHPGITAAPVMLPADEVWPEARQDGLKFTVRIPSTIPEGLYEARVHGKFGVSPPRMFMVTPKSGPAELSQGSGNESAETARSILLDQYVNATCPANGSDYYQITAKKGQRILVHCWASRIDSRMDASVSIWTQEGEKLSAAHDSIDRDPVVDFVAPEDGEYIVKVHDFLFLGGSNHFYRLVATTRPHIDGVFPLAGVPGTTQQFTIYGRNLPNPIPNERIEESGVWLETQHVSITIPENADPIPLSGLRPMQQFVEGFNFSIGQSNPVRIGFASRKPQEEDKNSEETRVSWPGEVAGKFDFSGDDDRYRFTATKGQEIWLEVVSDRFSVSTDPHLLVQQVVRSEDGTESLKVLKEADDFVISGSLVGFDSRTFDGGMLFTAPADGEYQVRVSNNFGSHGPLESYQLVIREAKPRFQLIAIADSAYQEARTADPGTAFLHASGTTSVRVVALRLDGFDGAIEISAQGLPDGVEAKSSQIWDGANETRLILSAADSVETSVHDMVITGRSGEIVEEARVGTLRWGVRDYSRERYSSRLTSTMPLHVSSQKAVLALSAKEEKTWEVELQKQLDLPIMLTKNPNIKGNVAITPYGLPNFRRPPSVNIAEKDKEGTLKISFRVDGNNRPKVSEGLFMLRANGVLGKYRTSPEDVDKWSSWQKIITEKAKNLVAAKALAESNVEKATEALTQAQGILAAATGESKPELEKAVVSAQAELDDAKAGAAKANALVQRAEAAKKIAAAELKKASDRAKERDVKFTVYSAPISLRITAPPEKK